MNATSKVRSYITVEGDITGMRLEVIPTNGTIALVAPIRLNATRETLDRIRGQIPDDYYSRFDRYPNEHWLSNRAETHPVCANELGFTKALASQNDMDQHYCAGQRYHLLMKPPSGFDCINRIMVANPVNGVQMKRPTNDDAIISYGYEDASVSCSGFSPNKGSLDYRKEIEAMPMVRYTWRSPSFRNPKCRITPSIKAKIQHAVSLHSSAELVVANAHAPFGPYWAIGTDRNFLKTIP